MFKIFRGDTMSLKWAINGVLDDIYFYAQGIPRLFIAWKPDNKLVGTSSGHVSGPN